jgi:hypothetical protein
MAGLLLAIPDLLALDLPALTAAASYPGSVVVPATNWVLALLDPGGQFRVTGPGARGGVGARQVDPFGCRHLPTVSCGSGRDSSLERITRRWRSASACSQPLSTGPRVTRASGLVWLTRSSAAR